MPDTTQLNLKIPKRLKAAINAAAKKAKKTASAYIRVALSEATGYDGPNVKMGAPVKNQTGGRATPERFLQVSESGDS